MKGSRGVGWLGMLLRHRAFLAASRARLSSALSVGGMRSLVGTGPESRSDGRGRAVESLVTRCQVAVEVLAARELQVWGRAPWGRWPAYPRWRARHVVSRVTASGRPRLIGSGRTGHHVTPRACPLTRAWTGTGIHLILGELAAVKTRLVVVAHFGNRTAIAIA
jgi:hypothetical protein